MQAIVKKNCLELVTELSYYNDSKISANGRQFYHLGQKQQNCCLGLVDRSGQLILRHRPQRDMIEPYDVHKQPSLPGDDKPLAISSSRWTRWGDRWTLTQPTLQSSSSCTYTLIVLHC